MAVSSKKRLHFKRCQVPLGAKEWLVLSQP